MTGGEGVGRYLLCCAGEWGEGEVAMGWLQCEQMVRLAYTVIAEMHYLWRL